MDNRRGGTITVPVLDVKAGEVSVLGGDNPWLLICLVGRPQGFAISELCLASRKNAADRWTCVDQHVLLATRGQICGYTPHLTQFAIIPKEDIDSFTDDTPVVVAMAIESSDRGMKTDDASSVLPIWAIGVIIAAGVLCCLLLLLLCFCVVRKRSSGKPKQQRRRANSDSDGEEKTALKVYDDKSVTNPAFARDSDAGDATPMGKPPTLRGADQQQRSQPGDDRKKERKKNCYYIYNMQIIFYKKNNNIFNDRHNDS